MKDSNSCFNCEHELIEESKFCSNCGQKVDNNNLTLKAVLVEFYENYLSFDTKLGRSIFPFLFVPGKLTKKFIDGKRVSFVNPFRFYLIISLLFFYALGTVLEDSFSSDGVEKSKFSEKISEEVDKISHSEELDQLKQLIDSIKATDSLALSHMNYDSLLKANHLEKNLSLELKEDSSAQKKKKRVFINTSGTNLSFNFSDFKILKKYRYDFEYTNRQLLDTLGVNPDSISEFHYIMVSQGVKLYRSNSKIITKFFLGNFSIAMFALIPMMALLLMLFYYKSRIPFVAHLIHSLQLHTFSLLIFSLALLIIHFTDIHGATIVALLITALYFFFSFKRVYEKTYFSSFLRLVGVGLVYYIVWGIALALGVLLSFLLF